METKKNRTMVWRSFKWEKGSNKGYLYIKKT